jgi:hypothetical protein
MFHSARRFIVNSRTQPYQNWRSVLHPAFRQAIFSIGIQGWNLMSVGSSLCPCLGITGTPEGDAFTHWARATRLHEQPSFIDFPAVMFMTCSHVNKVAFQAWHQECWPASQKYLQLSYLVENDLTLKTLGVYNILCEWSWLNWTDQLVQWDQGERNPLAHVAWTT